MKNKHSVKLTRRALAALLAAGMSIGTIATPVMAAEDEILAETAAETEIEAVEPETAESEVVNEEISGEAPVYLAPTAKGTITGSGNYTAVVSADETACYAFTPSNDVTLIVESTSTSDTYGYLYYSDMSMMLTYDDDGGTDSNFKYSYICTGGVTYYIGMRFYSDTSGSIPFTVTVLDSSSMTAGWNHVGTKYYYVESGSMVKSSIKLINGSYYGFDFFGEMYENTTFTLNGNDYRAKAGGALYVNEWYKDESGNWYYYGKDGIILTGTVAQINSVWYGFNNDGRMYADTDFTIDSGNYRAAASGALYVNRWYTDTWGGYKYYYGPDCKAICRDVAAISGSSYAFDYRGRLYTDRAVTLNDRNYGADKNGVLTELKNNAWTCVDSSWYYVKDNTILVNKAAKIGSSYYGFDSKGKMIRSDSFYASGDSDYGFFRARADGTLYAGQWYLDAEGRWYYYNADASAASGLVTISGKLYAFKDDGELNTHSALIVDGVGYTTDHNGLATKLIADMSTGGWKKVNGIYYYVKDGQLLSSTTEKIGSAWYAFDYYGRMITDNTYYLDGYYVRARADGTLYVNQWYREGDYWYYYGNDGIAVSDIVTVNGKKYVFDGQGLLYTDQLVNVGAGYVLTDENGVLVEGTGWKLCGGEYYYLNSDSSVYSGKLVSGGKSYYLKPVMAHDTTVYIDGELYLAASDGSLSAISSDGFYTANYNTYYVKNGKLLNDGWLQLNGSWYYIYSGYRIESQSFQIDGKYYYFDQKGKMLASGWKMVSWGYKVYAAASGALLTGIQTVSGKTYYFDESGYCCVGAFKNTDGTYSIYGTDGQLIGKISGDGWHNVNGVYYYIQNGSLLKSTVAYIGGSAYGFDSYGAMYASRIFSNNGIRYYAGTSGALASGWFTCGNLWYYADPDTCALANGGTEINNTRYILSYTGKMETGQTVTEEKVRTSTSSGISFASMSDGWKYIDGDTYYYKNGEPYTGWVGNYYVQDGMLQRNKIVYDANGAAWYVDANGLYVTGKWVDGMYVKTNGHMAQDEWLTIGGKLYYFDSFYYVVGIWKINGTYYKFSESGVYLGEAETSAGWKSVDGSWYYFRNGRKVTSTSLKLNGSWYAFDGNGTMVTDSFCWDGTDCGTYYYQSNGARASYTGWKKIDGTWYYFDDQSMTVFGWLNEGSKTYYLDDGMVTGLQTIDGRLYQFDSTGVLTSVVSRANGWYSAGGNWYYFQNYSLVRNCLANIGGKLYAFDDKGHMLTGTVVRTDVGCYYINGSGILTTTSGTYTVDGESITVDSYGHVMFGYYWVNGKEKEYCVPSLYYLTDTWALG